MRSEVSVRQFSSSEWQKYRSLRLRALSESPDAFGSTFDQEHWQPDDGWSRRLATGVASTFDLPLLAEVAAEPVGLAWARVDPSEPQVARLYQMWVDPGFRSAGVGRALLHAAIEWAKAAGAQSMCLNATCGTTPAARLYARAGFVPIGDAEPIRPGSAVLARLLRLDLRTA
jgi:GNAT superfamily N-acetyltransferase